MSEIEERVRRLPSTRPYTRFGYNSGLVVLGVGEQVMEIKNRPGFTPRYYW